MSLVPQFGFFELLVVAVIALVVVGPKDLPKLMRMAGKAFGQAKRMAAEFTSAFDQMARESEMEEMRKEIESLKDNNFVSEARRAVDDAVKPVDKMMRDESKEMRDAVNRPPAPETKQPPKDPDPTEKDTSAATAPDVDADKERAE